MTLLPPNSTDLELALEKVSDPDLDPDVIRTLWNPWTCPIGLLPWLAWALSVDDWDNDWDEQTQRQVVAASVQIHQRKGTVGAVRRAMASLGHESRLIEWWQMSPSGVPHTFVAEVDIDSRGIAQTLIAALERQINRVKPVRSHYLMRLIAKTRMTIRVGSAVISGETVEIRPLQVSRIEPEPTHLRTALGVQDWAIFTLYPKSTT